VADSNTPRPGTREEAALVGAFLNWAEHLDTEEGLNGLPIVDELRRKAIRAAAARIKRQRAAKSRAGKLGGKAKGRATGRNGGRKPVADPTPAAIAKRKQRAKGAK
jgi:hypothetical protein